MKSLILALSLLCFNTHSQIILRGATLKGATLGVAVASAPPPADSPLVTGQSISQGTRNNVTGLVGMRITIGAAPITITSLGRWVISGNHNSHVIHLRNSSCVDITTCTVNAALGTPATFQYGSITPTVLSAGGVYYIMEGEDSSDATELWYDQDTVTVDSVLSDWNASFDVSGCGLGVNHSCYVPVSGLYHL